MTIILLISLLFSCKTATVKPISSSNLNQSEVSEADINCDFKDYCNCNNQISTISNSYRYSDLIFSGVVKKIEIVPLKKVISEVAIKNILSDSTNKSDCVKKVLNTMKIIQATFKKTEVFKGDTSFSSIKISTPLDENQCSFKTFKKGEKFTVYASQNKSCDIYFLSTYEDNKLFLNPTYKYWTNQCKRTRISSEMELDSLRVLNKLK